MKESGFSLYLVNEEHFRDKIQEPLLETGPASNQVASL
jgi:hypothetical protein